MNEVAATPVAGGPVVAAAPEAAAPLDPANATAGQRLRAARERRGLSLQKAADKMHLDRWVIEALEADQFDKIGPSVYVKGHLKHYAGMLGLSAAEILAVYDAPPAIVSQRGTLRLRTQEPVGLELPWGTIAAAAIAAVLISAVVWLRPWRARSPPAAPPAVAQAAQAAPGGAAVDIAADNGGDDAQANGSTAADDGATDTAVPVTAAPASTAPASPALPAPLPGAGRAQLRLSFSADSWIEVRDAAGNAVFAGTGHANSVQTVTGDAPLRVYLRSASGVQLAVNRHVVAIGPQFVAGDVARFEAGADGVLRRDTHSPSSSAAAHEPRPHG